MACIACGKAKPVSNTNPIAFPPYNSGDISIYTDGDTRRLLQSDWPPDKHKLLFFIDDVVGSELDLLKPLTEQFNELGCEVYLASSEQLHILRDFVDNNESLKDPNFKVISSYLLPTRLGILVNGRSKRCTVFITKDGEVTIEHHINGVARSIGNTYNTIECYVNKESCG